MNIKWLQTFIITAQYENLRKASELLFLTQPAVTKHIQRLEQQLHCSLFDRKGKQVILNAAGQRFLPIAQKIVETYETELQTFKAWQSGFTQQLTITVAPQIASSILPPILKDFRDHQPTIETLIQVANSYEVIQHVLDGKADIGLTRTVATQANLKSELIFQEPVVLIAPYDAAPSTENQIFDTYRLITHNHPVYWDDLLLDVTRHYPHVKTFRVNQIEVTKKFIEQGLGISYLPYSMVEKELEEKLFKLIPSDTITTPISHTYVITKVESDDINTFVTFLKCALQMKKTSS